jgi:hypothetical protein
VKQEDDRKEGVRAGLNPFFGTRPDTKDAVGGSRPETNELETLVGDNPMTTDTNNLSRPQRQTLASQIDRLENILAGLTDTLGQTVAEAVQDAVGKAVELAVKEVLTNPELLCVASAPRPAGQPAPVNRESLHPPRQPPLTAADTSGDDVLDGDRYFWRRCPSAKKTGAMLAVGCVVLAAVSLIVCETGVAQATAAWVAQRNDPCQVCLGLASCLFTWMTWLLRVARARAVYIRLCATLAWALFLAVCVCPWLNNGGGGFHPCLLVSRGVACLLGSIAWLMYLGGRRYSSFNLATVGVALSLVVWLLVA